MSNTIPLTKMPRPNLHTLGLLQFIAFIFFQLLSLPSLAQVIEGLVYPLHDLSISASASGEVLYKRVVAGARVRKGQELLTIDNRIQNIERDRRKTIFDDNSELDAEREKNILIKETLNRAQQVFDLTGTISKDELTKLKAEYISSSEKVNQLMAQKSIENAEYREAEKETLSRTITAPISGVITKISPEQGEWVRQGDPIINLVNVDACIVKIAIPLQYTLKVKENSNIRITLEKEKGNIYTAGRFLFVSPVADPASGLVEAKIIFDNKKLRIKPGIKAAINLD